MGLLNFNQGNVGGDRSRWIDAYTVKAWDGDE